MRFYKLTRGRDLVERMERDHELEAKLVDAALRDAKAESDMTPLVRLRDAILLAPESQALCRLGEGT